jgi:hypothetical protein
MSRASRYCGTGSGARAGDRNAVPAPGVNGKPREHYDSRASRQLGIPSREGTKSEPESENAASGVRAPAPHSTPNPVPREPRLRASPPVPAARPPPRAFGHDVVERDEALAVCPDVWCRRAGRCHHEATPGRPCFRFYEPAETARKRLARKLLQGLGTRALAPPASLEETQRALARLRRALDERQRNGD